MTLEQTLAQAIADAFWETAERPRSWVSMTPQQKQVFTLCAKRAVEAAHAYREARKGRLAA